MWYAGMLSVILYTTLSHVIVDEGETISLKTAQFMLLSSYG